jgi:hypothetical protein
MSAPLFDVGPEVEQEAPAPVAPPERHVLDLLHQRYGQTYGNGFRYAVAEHVRSHGGFDARRTADFVAMDLWPSKGFALHGHEVKVSRSDWLGELRQPEKSAEFIPYMTYWWIVAGHNDIVRKDELPPGWGLLIATLRRPTVYHWQRDGTPTEPQPVLRVARQAKRNEKQLPLTPTRIAALLRAVAKTAKRVQP